LRESERREGDEMREDDIYRGVDRREYKRRVQKCKEEGTSCIPPLSSRGILKYCDI
jgi:hypothetical protein